jgi:hypothetical protein
MPQAPSCSFPVRKDLWNYDPSARWKKQHLKHTVCSTRYSGRHGRSAVNISSSRTAYWANTSDTKATGSDIAPPMTIESPQVYRGVLPAARTGEREPRQSGRDGIADRRIEPQRAPACLPRIPDGNDLVRFGNRLAFGLGALGLSRRTCCGETTSTTQRPLPCACRSETLLHSS